MRCIDTDVEKPYRFSFFKELDYTNTDDDAVKLIV